MTEKDIEKILKQNIYKEVNADGQSDKYFENLWLVWWGMMGTDIKNGLVKSFNEVKNEQDIEKVCDDYSSINVNNQYIGDVFQWLINNDYIIYKK